MRERPNQKFEAPNCPACGEPSRTKFKPPASSARKNTKLQHVRWRVCRRGHKFVFKRR